MHSPFLSMLFFFHATATTEIYTLSLHDALPISSSAPCTTTSSTNTPPPSTACTPAGRCAGRSEEHTSELQSRQYLVCRLLLEKKKIQRKPARHRGSLQGEVSRPYQPSYHCGRRS